MSKELKILKQLINYVSQGYSVLLVTDDYARLENVELIEDKENKYVYVQD